MTTKASVNAPIKAAPEVEPVAPKIKLTAALLEGFAGTFLSPMYDNPKPTPQFHRDSWALYCSDITNACVVAPRGHAKSTALTHVFTLATALFRQETYMILVGSNEEMAIEALGDIARELRENELLIEHFEIKGFAVDAKTDIIVQLADGHEFRIIARGSGQKMRGRKWKGKRPGLIICDDLEDDEQVESADRRQKFRKWFNRALIPAMRRGGKVRIHGTILHEDALLARLQKDSEWGALFFKAHEGFDDFSNILWPEQFTEQALRAIRQRYINDMDPPGYSQEYLNDPFDNSEAYLRKDDFIGMTLDDFDVVGKVCIGVDFAVSKKDKANRSSFTTGSLGADNIIRIIDQVVGRMDSGEIIEEMFSLQERHSPEFFFVEDGVIWKTLEPLLIAEMQVRGVFLNCLAIVSAKDKATRGRSLQKRMRAGAVRFHKQAAWYVPYENEMLRFTGMAEATLDDQFDSTAILSIGFDMNPVASEEDFMDEEEIYFRGKGNPNATGRNRITGY